MGHHSPVGDAPPTDRRSLVRPITGIDIMNFHYGRDDLLVLTAEGKFTSINRSDIAYSPGGDTGFHAYTFVITKEGNAVQILLDRSTLDGGAWFPNAVGDNGLLIPSVADEMAEVINKDGILPSRVANAVVAESRWRRSWEHTNRLAVERAKDVAAVVSYCAGNQSQAARLLHLHQSTVNKLVKKAEEADGPPPV